MHPSPQQATISVDRAAFRSLVIQLLLSPTTNQATLTQLEQFFTQIGLKTVDVFSVYYAERVPYVRSRTLVVDETSNKPINDAVNLSHCSAEEVNAHLKAGRSEYDLLGATYFSNYAAAEMARLSLLKLPAR